MIAPLLALAPLDLLEEPRLSDLVRRSDVVAVVRAAAGPPEVRVVTTTVELDVLEWIAGDEDLRDGSPLRVRYAHQVLCPAPPSYPPDEIVLTFLERAGEGRFRAVGRGYGANVVEGPVDGSPLVQRVRELVAMQSARPDDWWNSDTAAEWVVRCLEDPTTLREGARELGESPRERALHRSPEDYDAPRPSTVPLSHFDGQKRARIVRVLAGGAPLDAPRAAVLYAFEPFRDPAFDAVACARILEGEWEEPWIAVALVEFLAMRSHDPEVEAIAVAHRECETLRRSTARREVPPCDHEQRVVALLR